MQDTYEYKEIGLPMEIMAQNIIKRAYRVQIIETCNNADFDFKDSNNITYEIKADRRSISTHNFFITYAQQTLAISELQPTGISKSKADYHMLMYGENVCPKLSHMNARNEEIYGLLVKVSSLKPYAIIYDFII